MAISVDSVYQKVLALANKEQRGYITPQEFNLLAGKAQNDIFETYFHEIANAKLTRGDSGEYSDQSQVLKEKIAPFEKHRVVMSELNNVNELTLPVSSIVHKLGAVFYNNGTFDTIVEFVDKKDFAYMDRSGKTSPTASRPVYNRVSSSVIKLYPKSLTTAYTASNVTCNFIAKPLSPKWTYVVVNDKALYNASNAGAQDFQLHASEESTLTNKILELAGIIVNKPGLSEVVLRNEAVKEENRK